MTSEKKFQRLREEYVLFWKNQLRAAALRNELLHISSLIVFNLYYQFLKCLMFYYRVKIAIGPCLTLVCNILLTKPPNSLNWKPISNIKNILLADDVFSNEIVCQYDTMLILIRVGKRYSVNALKNLKCSYILLSIWKLSNWIKSVVYLCIWKARILIPHKTCI